MTPHTHADDQATATQIAPECGTLVAAAKVTRILDLLRSLPMDLPEPSVTSYADGVPAVTWTVGEATARRIVAFLGNNDWSVYTYEDDPQTIADRYLERSYDHLDLRVQVVVDGVNLPDLADARVVLEPEGVPA